MISFLSKAKIKALQGTALVRLDFNAEDEWRMRAALPTIRFLRARAEKIIIISHRGRPKGFQRSFSLRKDANALGGFLRKKIHFLPRLDFKKITSAVTSAPRGSVFLLENLRFLGGEEANDIRLARGLASLADFYVNDAFAVSHRNAASVVAIASCLPSFAGLELEKEIRFLSHALLRPMRPIVIVIGGGKAHDKLMVMKYFKAKTDAFLMGGVAANTLLFLKKMNVGRSVIDRDPDDLKHFRAVLAYPNVRLPSDWKMKGGKILDIGTNTISRFEKAIAAARTIIWSGPMGFFEKKPYGMGTLAVARAIAKNRRAFSLAGGGETVAFLRKHHLDKKFSFISTGGGAMLEFLAGKKLPGIEALKR